MCHRWRDKQKVWTLETAHENGIGMNGDKSNVKMFWTCRDREIEKAVGEMI